jgi:hypothetical protein
MRLFISLCSGLAFIFYTIISFKYGANLTNTRGFVTNVYLRDIFLIGVILQLFYHMLIVALSCLVIIFNGRRIFFKSILFISISYLIQFFCWTQLNSYFNSNGSFDVIWGPNDSGFFVLGLILSINNYLLTSIAAFGGIWLPWSKKYNIGNLVINNSEFAFKMNLKIEDLKFWMK